MTTRTVFFRYCEKRTSRDAAARDVIVAARAEAERRARESSTMRSGERSVKSETSTPPATPITSSARPDAGTTLREVTAPSAGRAATGSAIGAERERCSDDDGQHWLHQFLTFECIDQTSES